jgi:hypothetical protein
MYEVLHDVPPTTTLEHSRITKIHNSGLDTGLAEFLAWCGQYQHPVSHAWNNLELMSGQLARYVQQCYDSGMARWHARYAVVAAQTAARHLKGRLQRAWDAVAAWHALQPSRSRVPLPSIVVESMALLLARQG